MQLYCGFDVMWFVLTKIDVWVGLWLFFSSRKVLPFFDTSLLRNAKRQRDDEIWSGICPCYTSLHYMANSIPI